MDDRDLREILVLLEQALLEKVFQEVKENRVPVVFLETQARKDLKETLETLDSQDNLEFLVI